MPEPILFSVSSFIGSAIVQIQCLTSGASIYYTTDGTTPSASNGTLYSSTFTVNKNTTVKAIAVKAGLLDSDVASVDITIALPTPVLEKQAGTAIDNCKVVITNLDAFASYSGVVFRYTTDGNDPIETSATTTGEIAVTANGTIKVKAFLTDYEASAVASLAVSDLKVQTPTITTVE